MAFPRRSFLISGCTVVASLSGCLETMFTDGSKVNLSIFNYTSETQPLLIEILQENSDEYSDALVFDREFKVPPPQGDESAGVVRESNIVSRRRYLVRVLPKYGRDQWRHYHFYPGESSTDADSESLNIRIYRDEQSDELYTRFQ